MTSATPDAAFEIASAALADEPAGLLTDLDGTLAPIVADPAAVALEPGAATALGTLADRIAVTGIVTGRAAADARAIAGVPGLLVIGNHGLEWLEPDASEPIAAPAFDWVAAALERTLAAVHAMRDPGVTVDAKGMSATVHYRRARDPATARTEILAALAGADERIEIREGRMSVELRPAGAGDKGAALRVVAARHRLRGLVVAGDDMTDLDMFRAAAELRVAGHLRAAILAVGGGAEVPLAVADAADVVIPSVAAFVALLRRLAGSSGSAPLDDLGQVAERCRSHHVMSSRSTPARSRASRCARSGSRISIASRRASAVPTTSAGATGMTPSAIWSCAPAVSDRTIAAFRRLTIAASLATRFIPSTRGLTSTTSAMARPASAWA